MTITIEFSDDDWKKVEKLISAYEKNKEINRENARKNKTSIGNSNRGRKITEGIKWKIVEKELNFDYSEEEVEVVAKEKIKKTSV